MLQRTYTRCLSERFEELLHRCFFLVILVMGAASALRAQTDWPAYGHDPGGMRYSGLTQVNAENVSKLQLTWTYNTSEAVPNSAQGAAEKQGSSQGRRRAFRRQRRSQVTPLVIDNVMYLTTPFNRAVALEPETGKEIWEYEIHVDLGRPALRGLSYWSGDAQSPPTLFFGTGRGYLVALNAKTGKPVPGFADEGVLNLKEGRLVSYLAGAPVLTRREDKPRVYSRNGPAVLVCRPETLRANELYGDRCIPYLMSARESIDVDDPLDLEIAECLMRKVT